MSRGDTDVLLGVAVETILSTMFFAEPTAAEEPAAAEEPREPLTGAMVRFRGAPSGVLRLAAGGGAARVLAANFLGAEEPASLSGEAIREVLEEMANMVCGSLLSQLDARAHFDLDHPARFEMPAAAAPGFQWFAAEGGALAVAVELEPDA